MKRFMTMVAVTGVLGLTACGTSEDAGASGTPDPGATLRYATSAGVTSFDPHKNLSSSSFTVLNFVYDRLVHTDVEGQPIPGLAESWEFSEDGTALTFQLREGLTFADGEPFDADAVKANLDRAREPDSITVAQLEAVSDVVVLDPAAVELKLSRPATELVLTLSDMAGMMVSPAAFADAEQLAQQPVGLGRFDLTASEPGSTYDFTATEDYWDKDALKVSALEFSVVVDPQTNLNGIGSGEFDCALVSPAMIAPAEEIPDATVNARTVLTSTVLYYNQSKSEFDNALVRRALGHAIDKSAILEGAQEGQGAVAETLFPDEYWVDGDAFAGDYAYDVEKAKSLLAEAGLADGFSFTLITNNIPQFVTTAEIVKDQLAQVGVDVTIKSLPPLDVAPNWLKGEGDAVISGWTGRADPAGLLAAYFDKDAPSNVSRVEAEGFSEALTAANAVVDQAERGDALAQAMKVVLDTGAVVPLTFNNVGTVCGDHVTGYKPSIIGMSELRGVGINS